MNVASMFLVVPVKTSSSIVKPGHKPVCCNMSEL